VIEVGLLQRWREKGEDRFAERGGVHRVSCAHSGLNPQRTIDFEHVHVDDQLARADGKIDGFAELQDQILHIAPGNAP